MEEVEPPPITEPARAWFQVAVAEMKTMLFPLAQQHGSATIKQIFDWYERMAQLVRRRRLHAGRRGADADDARVERVPRPYPLVLTPFLMRPTFSWNYDAESYENTKDLFDAAIYSYGINYLGLPAGVVPIGLVEGLPAGVQIVGRRFREDTILEAMTVVESRVGVLTETLWARK